MYASHSVQCAISSLNSVDAEQKQRSQEDKTTASTDVGPAAPFSLGVISTTSSPVMSGPIISGHSSYFSNDIQEGSSTFGCLMSGEQSHNVSMTRHPVFSSVSSGCRIPPFFQFVMYLTASQHFLLNSSVLNT